MNTITIILEDSMGQAVLCFDKNSMKIQQEFNTPLSSDENSLTRLHIEQNCFDQNFLKRPYELKHFVFQMVQPDQIKLAFLKSQYR